MEDRMEDHTEDRAEDRMGDRMGDRAEDTDHHPRRHRLAEDTGHHPRRHLHLADITEGALLLLPLLGLSERELSAVWFSDHNGTEYCF